MIDVESLKIDFTTSNKQLMDLGCGKYSDFFKVYAGMDETRERVIKDLYTFVRYDYYMDYSKNNRIGLIMSLFLESDYERLLIVGEEGVDDLAYIIDVLLNYKEINEDFDIVSDDDKVIVASITRIARKYALKVYKRTVRLDLKNNSVFKSFEFVIATRGDVMLEVVDGIDDFKNYVAGRVMGVF